MTYTLSREFGIVASISGRRKLAALTAAQVGALRRILGREWLDPRELDVTTSDEAAAAVYRNRRGRHTIAADGATELDSSAAY